MKKWFFRISLTFLTILFLIGGALFFLGATQSGTNFIVTQAEKQLDGQLQIGSATGTLADRLIVTDLQFKSPATGKLALGKLILDWKSSDFSKLTSISSNSQQQTYTIQPLKWKQKPLPSPNHLIRLSFRNYSCLLPSPLKSLRSTTSSFLQLRMPKLSK